MGHKFIADMSISHLLLSICHFSSCPKKFAETQVKQTKPRSWQEIASLHKKQTRERNCKIL